MKSIYEDYNKKVEKVTLPPWSFVEPKSIKDPHKKTRELLFKKSKLTLLYTGTIGNAHEFDLFLDLARYLRLKKASVGFCFAGFGNRFEDLKYQVKPDDTNITFAGFVETDRELEERLSSADIMLISLKQSWTGISVPSKYFSALANGKAVLFLGSTKSALSIWTKEYNLGFVLEKDNVQIIGNKLIDISGNMNMISDLKNNSINIYNEKFSKKKICDGWSELIIKTIDN